jgi:IS6 family transposase
MFRMKSKNVFKWKQHQKEIILQAVRWYLSYGLSFRNVAEIMEERGFSMVHTTIMRWVHEYGPELEKRIRRHLRQTNDSWKVDETYIKIKGKWKYLYRAVDSEGNTIDFLLCANRDRNASSVRHYARLMRNLLEVLPWIRMQLIPLQFENYKKRRSCHPTSTSGESNTSTIW